MAEIAKKKKTIKCNECGKDISPFSWGLYVYKGSGNTYLCGGDWMKGQGVCGNNVCFKCGKVETRTKWVEGEDCCGNKVMREQKISMFKQTERDENDPDMELQVCYCDEHKEEAKKSPLRWTSADSERIERQKEQKKLEIEEKLNSQKGLFYCYEPFPRSVERRKQEKGTECVYFWGKENGQNFFLMVPDTHSVLNGLKYTEKVKSDYDGREIEYTRYNLKKQFYLIEGIDNLPLEDTHNGYEGSDPYARAYKFNKFVGLNDKIKITPADSQGKSDKNKPIENKPTDISSNSQSEELNDKTLLQYFQKNDIKSIKIENEKLIIERNDNSTSTNLLTNFCELKGIDRYLQTKNDKKVSRQELELNNNSDTTPTTKSRDNSALWIGCGIGGVLIIAVIVGLLLKKKRTKKH